MIRAGVRVRAGMVLTGGARRADRSDGKARVLGVGAIVDDFELLDQRGHAVTLTDLLASGPLVLYFFVKAKTPG